MILERAIVRLLKLGTRLNQATLYLLREMEMGQDYRELGFTSLNAWAYARLDGLRSTDSLSRLCAVTTKVIATLDAEPMITEDGEKINGLVLLAEASTTALIRTAGTFAESDEGQRRTLVYGLLTGTSDDRLLKGSVGWEPKIGKARAQFQQVSDDEVDIHIRATPEQARVIENNIRWMTDIQFTELT